MGLEVLNVTVTCRVDKDEVDELLLKIRRREVQVVAVPSTLSRVTAERWQTGSTDMERPQIRVEYMK